MKNNNINIKKYSPFNIEQFKNWLRDMKEKNETKFFEVYVDDFKVVPRTENPDDFDSHQQYVDDETTKIRILIYNTAGSNRYTQTIFTMKENPVVQQQPLSGVEMETKIEDGINKGLKAMEERLACEQVKKELEETKKRLSDSEEYAEKLKGRIETLKEKLDNAKNVKEIINAVTEFGPAILGVKTKSDPSLSGAQTEKKPEEQASFKMKTEGETSLSEQEKYFIDFGKSIQENFTQEEFDKVLSIIGAFSKKKSDIDPVMSLLNINPQKTTNENGKV